MGKTKSGKRLRDRARVGRCVAPPAGLSYLAVVLVGCGGGLPPSVLPAPGDRVTMEDAAEWVSRTRPDAPLLYRFRFTFRDQDGSAGGRGSARMTPGDSLRFDVAGPLGTGRGAAFVIGDSALWAEPEEDVRKLVPNYPLLWAMLGVARLPVPVGEVTRYQDQRLTAWRFVHGGDTTEYALLAGSTTRLIADVRQGGKRVGRVETVFDADGRPSTSRLDVPSAPARLDIRFVSTSIADPFPADTWLRPAP